MRNISFAPLIRDTLASKFIKAQERLGRTGDYYVDEAELFIRRLESIASAIPSYKGFEPPPQEVRRKKLNTVARHLADLTDLLRDIDSAALGFFLHQTLLIVEKKIGEGEHVEDALALMNLAQDAKDEALEWLPLISLGAQVSAKNLPPMTFNFHLQTALAVERIFWEYGFPFTVTATGFAGLCLSTIFDEADAEATSIAYWLRRARDNYESMGSAIKRYSQRLTNE